MTHRQKEKETNPRRNGAGGSPPRWTDGEKRSDTAAERPVSLRSRAALRCVASRLPVLGLDQ